MSTFEPSAGDLASWKTLNDALRLVNEDGCYALLNMEKKGEARLRFLNRIHGALNKKRYEREREELRTSARRN